MSAPQSVLVVGGGLAGAKTVEALRGQGYAGRLVLVGAETDLPYERPPLSKGYLLGTASFEDARVHPAEWYAEQDVELRLGVRATEVRRDAREVALDDGTALTYDALVLATGATPRRLRVPGADADGTLTLRELADAAAIRATFGGGNRLVVVGGGWIGLEVAAAARQAGTEVTVVEAAALPLLAVLGPEVARVFADLHRAHGVRLRTEASVEAFTTDAGRVTGVRLADGTVEGADAVVVGVGVAPNVALAEAAGLAVDNGVLVDAALRTSDPAIWAVGDIANAEHPLLGMRVRVEHWANALNQPATAAASILGGRSAEDASFDLLPYFFTDQYDLGMEYSGYVPRDGYDRVVFRGDPTVREASSPEFIVFWLRENRVLAGMNVNVWDVNEDVQELAKAGYAGRAVDPDRLADPDVPLGDALG